MQQLNGGVGKWDPTPCFPFFFSLSKCKKRFTWKSGIIFLSMHVEQWKWSP